nr:gag pol polyprotein [Hymenolepis microstoma]
METDLIAHASSLLSHFPPNKPSYLLEDTTSRQNDVLAKLQEKLVLSRRDTQRSISPKRSRSSPKYRNQIYSYHKKFGDEGKECQPGCNYFKTKTTNSGRKTQGQAVKTITDPGHFTSHLLDVIDRNPQLKFLVDTGQRYSSFCRKTTSATHQHHPSDGKQFYVQHLRPKFFNLDLKLHREFSVSFLIVTFQKPIIGAEFLTKFHLLINLCDRTTLNNLISLQVACGTDVIDSIGPHVLFLVINLFSDILFVPPSVFRPQSDKLELTHGMLPPIITREQSVFTKARRLHSDKLLVAKKEFQQLAPLGRKLMTSDHVEIIVLSIK